MSTVLLIVAAVLVLTLVILITMTGAYYQQSELCRIYPSPWCWDDWKCMDGSNPTDKFKQILTNCQASPTGQPTSQCNCAWGWYAPPGQNFCVTN